jgi:hypothetical protein
MVNSLCGVCSSLLNVTTVQVMTSHVPPIQQQAVSESDYSFCNTFSRVVRGG